jgi:hypothetical protein
LCLLPSNGNENGVSEKICEISYEKFFSSLYTHEKGKNSRVFGKIHINFIIGLFAPTPNSWERSKVNPLCKKVFIPHSKLTRKRKKEGFLKNIFYSSPISHGNCHLTG